MSPDGEEARTVALSFSPDNLKWADGGRLLVAGGRLDPREFIAAVTENPTHPCPIAVAAVAAVDPESLDVEMLIDEDVPFGLPTTAITAGGDLYLTSLFTNRLARLRISKEIRS